MTFEEQLNIEQFQKWSDNNGSIDVDTYNDWSILDCFSHWTYQHSNGYLLVTDLQGVKIQSSQYFDHCSGEVSQNSKRFVLTDPVIHCIDGDLYGAQNRQLTGILTYFQTHVCNKLCKLMELKEQPAPRMSSTADQI